MIKKLLVILISVVGFLLVAFGTLYYSGFRRYRFPSAGMEPTILKGSYAICRLSESYRNHIERFQIVVFTTDQVPGQIYAKRVVGLPGERVIISDRSVSINGRKLALPSAIRKEGLGIYRPPGIIKNDVVVAADSVFLLGDNTGDSLDSRYFGSIPERNVIGRILFKR
jgi:signal peptidase I